MMFHNLLIIKINYDLRRQIINYGKQNVNLTFMIKSQGCSTNALQRHYVSQKINHRHLILIDSIYADKIRHGEQSVNMKFKVKYT